MKKLLLSAAVVLGSILSTQAQTTIMSQPFSTATIPSGWSLTTAAVPAANWTFTNAWGSEMQYYFPAQGYMACIDDYDNNSTDIANWDTLKGPSMNCAAYTKVFISLNYTFWVDQGNETSNIIYSTNGGATWAVAVSLANTENGWSNGVTYDISTYAAGQSSIMIGFTYYNGYSTPTAYPATGMAIQDVDVFAPLSYDLSTASQNLPYLMQVGTPYTFTGTINNLGYTTVTSMDMNYSANSAATKTQTNSPTGFSEITTANWTMNTQPYTPTTTGPITVKYWVNNINGTNADGNPSVDTLVAHFLAVDSIQPKTVMFEEISCASCNPCMYAMPNIDSVAENTLSYCNTIRFHWYYPGQDMINQETATIVNDRMTYYNQDGVPVSEIDGAYWYPGAGSLSSGVIQQAKAIGSPFKIQVNDATYNPTTKNFNFNATIEAYGNFPAGLKAQVYLTEDSVDFKTDQSTEDPLSSFEPPLGTTSAANGGNPDYLADGVLNFPDAVENAFPSESGTSLAAFTSGSSQTINVNWVQNHPWAAKYNSYHYDSSSTQHLTIFIQDNNGNAAAGVPAQYVYQSKKVLVNIATGIEEIANGVSFGMYPNPTNNNTTLAFNLDKNQNVNVQVFNMLGQQVYSDNEGIMSSGQHTILINGSSLKNGVYFVRFNTDNASTTQKLVIQK